MTILYVIGGVVAILILWRVVLASWLKTEEVRHYIENLKLDRQSRAQALTEPTRIAPDPVTGCYPMLQEPGGSRRILDPDRGLSFDFGGLLNASPEVHLWAARRRIVQALHVNIPGGGDGGAVAGLLQGPQRPVQWPELVDLKGEFANSEPTLNDLVVGVYPDEKGERQRLSASIHDLMHVLVVGATGWGKSSWLRCLLWQVARAREPVDVVAIDVSGTEFNTLKNWSKLRYPVAKETLEAAALLQVANDELTRRKALYTAHPRASKLTEYNRLADVPLSPWLILVDEGAALLNDRKIGDLLRRGVQQARQYGLYFVVSGVSADHRTIETRTRDQFSTRLCFHTSPTSSRVVLEDSGAASIKDKGRALAQLVGKELCEVQGPYITKADFEKALTEGGPRFPMPEVSGNGGNGSQAARIKALAEQGKSKRQICLDVFGYTGGAAYQTVTDVLEGDTTTT